MLVSRALVPLFAVLALAATVFAATPARAAFPAGLPVSPHLMGQNYWFNPPDSAYPIIKQSGVTLMRIGGKAYDDNPLSDAALLRQVDNIRAIGAEPLIQVSRHRSAAVAAATVTYLNVTHARAVKFWSIGNEPDMDWSGTEAALAAYVATYTKSHAVAMRDVDPTISISATDMAFHSNAKYDALLGGVSDITGRDPKGRFYVDGINFHRYPFANTITRSAVLTELHSALESRVVVFLTQIARANALHQRTGASALTWGLTEFNLTFNNPPTSTNNIPGLGVSSFLNGHFFAEYYRVLMKHGAHLVAPWSLLEGGGNGSTTDFGYIGGSWTAPVFRSSFYHLQMVATQLLPGSYLASTSSHPNLAILATTSPARDQLAVMLLNEDTNGHQSFTLRLNSDPVSAPGTKLNVSAGLAREFSGTLENQSTAVLLFDATGALRQRTLYSLARNQLNLPPLVEVFPVFTTAPAAPADLSVSPGDTSATLTWSASAATGYTVRRTPAAGSPTTTVATGVMATTFTDTALTNGTAYTYTVTALNSLGESPASASDTTTPQPLPYTTISFEAESLPVTATGSSTVNNSETAASAGQWVQLNASARAAAMEFTTPPIPVGFYRLELTYKSNTNRGQVSVAVNDNFFGPAIDQYAATPAFATATLEALVGFTSVRTHQIRLVVTGQNPASSGFLVSADRFTFVAPDVVRIVLTDLVQTADGAPKPVTVTTTPANVPLALTYNGSPTPPRAPGAYTVEARIPNPYYFGSASGTLIVSATPTTPVRLTNLAVRTTLAANQLLTVGLTLQGGEKLVLFRAAGPSLAALGAPGTMADPRLTLFQNTTRVAANDHWAGAPAITAASAAVGAFPFASATSLDAALLARIEGSRTVQVSGPAAGNVLVEAYDTVPGNSGRLINLSALNHVGTGSDLLIAGFTLTGSGSRTLLIRAVGPGLAALGVPSPLADPQLEVFSATTPPVRLADNDTHSPSLAPIAARVGAFALPSGSADAALLIDLPAGGYTVQVSGADGGTGAALIEVYELP